MRRPGLLGMLLGASVALCAAPARAQPPGGGQNEATVTPPGERLAITPTQVEMRSGRYAYSQTDLAIGEDSPTSGLALVRGMEAVLPGHGGPFANFGHNWEIMLSEKRIDIDQSDFTNGNGPDYRMFVHFDGRSETFDAKMEDSGYQQSSNNWRATLVSSGAIGSGTAAHTYTAADGTIAVFRPLGGAVGGDCSTLRRCAYVSYVVHPDGTRFDFAYDPGSPARLRTVTSNRGYALRLHYGAGSDANHVTSACLFNLAVQAIPAGNSCTGAQASTSYGYTTFESQRRLASATDAGGGVSGFTYARAGGVLQMGFLRPGDDDPWLVNSLTERTDNEGVPQELVARQDFVDETDWRYFWVFAPPVEGEIAQIAGGSYFDAAGNTTQISFGTERRPAVAGPSPVNVGDILWQITPGPAEITDPLARTTAANYCDRAVWAALAGQQHRCLVTLLQSFTEPDGRVTELSYDGHTTRNVTEVRRKARPGSTQPNGQPWPDIVTSATYSCVNNIVCNRPTSRTDARGNTTDYVWDAVHGGLIRETGPAPTLGAPRPQTRHNYALRQARRLDGSEAGPEIWVRTTTSLCRTSAPSNPGPCAVAGDEVLTAYEYGPTTGPNNLLLRGQTVTATDNGVTTTLRTCYTYDARGRRIGETRPNANLPNCPASQSSALPFTSNQRYDAMGRVTGTISADPDTVGSGNPHLAVRNSYDPAGRLIRVETGTLAGWQSDSVLPSAWTGFTVQRTAETFYDAMGRKIRDQLREGTAGAVLSLTQYRHDVMSRLECNAVRMNPAVFAYYLTSNPLSACLPGTPGAQGPDRIGRNVYDAAGQRAQLREGVGIAGQEAAEATWEYNDNGQIITVIDGNGNRAALRYDGHGRQDRWSFPVASGAGAANPAAYVDTSQATALASAGAVNAADYEEYGYDANGNRTSLRKRDGSVLTYQYDALGRMTRKTVPDRAGLDSTHERDVFYGYDLRGLQLFARFDSASGQGVTSSWDGFGRPVSSSIDMDGVTRMLAYQWDRNGNRTRITHPGGAFFGAAYDGLDRPTWLTDPNGSALAGFNYAAAGVPSGIGRPGATTGLQHDALGRLTSLSHYLPAPPALDVGWTYTRNPAGQIASVTRSSDAYAWTRHYGVTRPYTVNGLNQYLTAGLPGAQATFDHDDNGNLISDAGRALTYDVENRLVTATATVDLPAAALRYDPLGRLYELTSNGATTRFLYDGDALVAEYNAAGTMMARYVHGVGADVPLVEYRGVGASTAAAHRRNLLADHQGSIVAVFDNDDHIRLSVNAYDEHGFPGSTNSGRFQYTGQIWLAELGMYHYKARLYSPALGRFLQVDPVGYEDQFNLYAYVGNDPVNAIDPMGMYTCDKTADCEQFEKARQALIQSRDQFEAGSDEYSRINASLQNIGAPGEGEMVVSGATAFQNADGSINTSVTATMQGNTMTIYSAGVEAHPNFGLTESEHLGGVLAHEADTGHMSGPRSTGDEFVSAEKSGYRTQDAARRGFDRMAGRAERAPRSERQLEARARGSLFAACRASPRSPVCQ